MVHGRALVGHGVSSLIPGARAGLSSPGPDLMKKVKVHNERKRLCSGMCTPTRQTIQDDCVGTVVDNMDNHLTSSPPAHSHRNSYWYRIPYGMGIAVFFLCLAPAQKWIDLSTRWEVTLGASKGCEFVF